MEKLKSAVPETLPELQTAFQSFSSDFDGIVLELKDKYLNVTSKDKPEGLLDVEFSASAFYLLRSLMSEITTVEQFVPICIRFFWGLLDPSLKTARDFLTGPTKKRFSVVFETLRSQAFALITYENPALAELSIQIGDASASVQSELDKIAGWLDRQEVREGKTSYTLKQAFEVAIESVLGAHKTFKPDISLTVASEVNVSAGEMILLADAMRVLLGNVDAHSDTRKPPKVTIAVAIDETLETLTIRCDSEVRKGVRTVPVEDRLSQIRGNISDGTYALGLRSEGGTGLKRLAHLVGKSKHSNLDFGFTDDESFFVEMAFPLFTFERAFVRVLLIEDEVPKQEHILSALKELRPLARVRVARSLKSAIEEIVSDRPNLVLLDMSLPTFDIGPKESGGRPQNFGGVEVLRYMELYDLHFPTVVITAYEAFSKGGKPVDHDSLHNQLLQDHPSSYKGLIYYNSLFSEWRRELADLISNIEQQSQK
jgi:CheY-like chemotaxis protein